MAVGTVLALTELIGSTSASFTIGAKNFSEQFILADLMAQRLEAIGATVQRRENLGSAIVFRALASSDIDVYVDYAGTLWTNVMKRHDMQPRELMLHELSQWMAHNKGVLVLGTLGFENAYALAMRPDRAEALRIHTIEDLMPHAPQLTLGADLEFLSRPEWSALESAYSLRFASERSFNPTFMYRAIADGSVDVISAFTSDGRLTAQNLVVLDDVKHAIPNYDAVILISPKRSSDSLLLHALNPLIGKISIESMRAANLMVDRDTNKATPAEAANYLAHRIGLQN
jgi:osmoprotectant transport system permease protein